jgi:hypothetical protein
MYLGQSVELDVVFDDVIEVVAFSGKYPLVSNHKSSRASLISLSVRQSFLY